MLRGVDKKGAAHIEMIVAFVFFMGFVLFLFITIKPYDTTILTGAVATEFYDSFEGAVATNLTNVFLKANASELAAGCFYVALPDEIFAYGFTDSVVTDLADNRSDSGLEMDGDLSIDDDAVFYKVAISSDFDDSGLSGCGELNDYYLGSLLEREVVSYKSLLEMRGKYNSDYDGLKADLKIPDIFDFSIKSEDLPEIKMEGLIPSSGHIEAREYVLEVLFGEDVVSGGESISAGTVENVNFILTIW